MYQNLLLIFCLFISLSGITQKKTNPVRFAKTITVSGLQKQLSIIAGAEMEGRDTPSPGLERAADYITAQFKKFGLKPGNKGSYRQTFSLVKDSVSLLSLSINNTSFKPYNDFMPLFVQRNVDFSFNEYVFIGKGAAGAGRNDYAGIDIKGKLVVLVSGDPNGMDYAIKRGAAAILLLVDKVPNIAKLPAKYKPVGTESEEKIPPLFMVNTVVGQFVTGHSFENLANDSGTTKIITAPVVLKCHLERSVATASNVLGMVEGTDKKDEYLFVTAHYDHLGKDANGNIFYGADDDGSGTAGVIKMAEAFAKAKKRGKGPRRSIVFMLVSGEEKGLWGSKYYSEHPVYPLDKTTADLNIDMIGRIDTERMSADSLNYIYVIGHNKLSTDLPVINEGANDKYTRLTLDYKYDNPDDKERIYYRSDHYNFARKGVPVLFFYDGMLKADYHKSTDTIEKINFALMAKRAKLIFYTAWEMANRNEMLKRDLKLQ